MAKQDLETLKIIINPRDKNFGFGTREIDQHPWGRFDPDTNTITMNSNLTHPLFMSALLHEMGHFYMKDVTPEQYNQIFNQNGTAKVTRPGYTLPEQLKEDAADAFSKWALKTQNGELTDVVNPSSRVNKPYYQYNNSGDVFEKGSARHIDFAEAKKKNIWRNIQKLNEANPGITPQQDTFFRSLLPDLNVGVYGLESKNPVQQNIQSSPIPSQPIQKTLPVQIMPKS